MQKIISFLVTVTVFFSSFFGSIGLGKSSKMTDEWKDMVKENYDEFISEVDGNEKRIPIIVHTDQHGAIKANSDLYKCIDEIVDWDKISRIINLGDTVTLISNTFELVNYKAATQCLPDEKRIECIGNHDRFFHMTKVGLFLSNEWFNTPVCEKSPDGRANTSTDEKFGVRYLSVDTNNFPWLYDYGTVPTSLADYIIAELSKTDDTDIVLLSHSYLFNDDMIRRTGDHFTGSENFIGNGEKGRDVKQSFVEMLSARRNKTAGVFTDSEGVKHPYDFSACKGDFLMSLHGHHHTEGYETKDGITEFLFQSMTKDNAENTEPNCFYFAYIDTDTQTFKCWKNVVGYDAWEISIK